jgi:uncharacterized membrane protein
MTRYINAVVTLVLFFIFLKLGSLSSVIDKLELGQQELLLGMVLATLGSLVGMQVVSIKTEEDGTPLSLGVNLGGTVVPLIFLLFFLHHHPVSLSHLALLTLIVAAVVYPLTRIDQRRGLIIYLFGAVVAAAVGALLLTPQSYLSLAYSSAVLGTLIGGDLLHLTEIRSLIERSHRTVFIGGGGLLDAIFLSGLLAMLTAETLHAIQVA